MIHVIATIEAVAGKRDALLSEMNSLLPAVRAEAGCIEYIPAIDAATDIAAQAAAGENAVVMVEKWETLDALKAHLQAPHMNEYRARVKDLVKGTHLQILESN